MKRGDHLVTPRTFYRHHGICVGDDKVIHYVGSVEGLRKRPIAITSIDEFAQDNPVFVCASPFRKYDAEQTVARAMGRLHEDKYNVITNSCEHFVYHCIYDVNVSPQVIDASLTVVSIARRASSVLGAAGIASLGNGVPLSSLLQVSGSTVGRAATASLMSTLPTVTLPHAATTALLGAAAPKLLTAGLVGVSLPVSIPLAAGAAAVGLLVSLLRR
jgi:hypothetical protein